MPGEKRERSSDINVEHLKGRYAIITTLITTFGVVVAAVIGAVVGYGSGQNQPSTENYIPIAEYETLSEEKANLEEQYSILEEKYNALLTQSEEKPASEPTGPITPSGSDSKEPIDLLSIGVLGNSDTYYNFTYDSPQVENTDTMSNTGERFDSCISMRSNGSIDFYLDHKYQSFTAKLCLSESTKNASGYYSTITIYNVTGSGADEQLEELYLSPAIKMGFIPTDIAPIDVSDVEHLRITFYTNGYTSSAPRIILGDPAITPK